MAPNYTAVRLQTYSIIQICAENADDYLPGNGAARVHGIAVDHCLVDATPVRTVSHSIDANRNHFVSV